MNRVGQWRTTRYITGGTRKGTVLSSASVPETGWALVYNKYTGETSPAMVNHVSGHYECNGVEVTFVPAHQTWYPVRHHEEDTALANVQIPETQTARLIGPRGGISAHYVVETADGQLAYKADGQSMNIKPVYDIDRETKMDVQTMTAHITHHNHTAADIEHTVPVVVINAIGAPKYSDWEAGQYKMDIRQREAGMNGDAFLCPLDTEAGETRNFHSISVLFKQARAMPEHKFIVPKVRGWDATAGALMFLNAPDNVILPARWSRIRDVIRAGMKETA